MPVGAFYVFPTIGGDRADRRRARRAAAPRGRRLRPRRDAFGGVGDEHIRISLRQLAREPDRGARAGSARFVEPARGGRRRDERTGRGSSSRAGSPTRGSTAVRAACDADLWEDELPPPRDELLRRVAGCDGVLTLLTDRVDDEFLDAAGPQLRVVSNYAVGFDNIDVAGVRAARRRGRQHAGRPDRDDRRPRLGAADGRRPARCPRATATSATAAGRPGARCCCSGRTSTARRSGSSGSGGSARRSRGGPQGFGMRDPVPRRRSRLPDDVTEPLGRDATCRSRSCSPRSDFVIAPRQPDRRDPAPDQRRDAGPR